MGDFLRIKTQNTLIDLPKATLNHSRQTLNKAYLLKANDLPEGHRFAPQPIAQSLSHATRAVLPPKPNRARFEKSPATRRDFLRRRNGKGGPSRVRLRKVLRRASLNASSDIGRDLRNAFPRFCVRRTGVKQWRLENRLFNDGLRV